MALGWDDVKAVALSQSSHVPGIFDEPTVDQSSGKIPRVPVSGFKVEYSTSVNATGVGWVTTTTYPGESKEEPAATNTEITLRTVTGVFDMPLRHQEVCSGLQDQVALQIAFKKRAILDELGSKIFEGSDASGEPKGLTEHLDSTNQVIDRSGGPLRYSDVTQLLLKVGANKGQTQYLVAKSDVIEKYIDVVVANGLSPELVNVPGLERPVPAHLGVPILRNDHLSNPTVGGVSTGRMFAMVVGDRDGLCTYVPKAADSDGFFVQRTTSFDDGNEFYRVSMSVAVVLFRQTAAAMLAGFTI